MAAHSRSSGSGHISQATLKEICAAAQQYSNSPMEANHFAGRDHGHGWESNKSLLAHGLIERTSHRSFATGFKGPRDTIRLTSAGREFVPRMLAKFDEQDDGMPLPALRLRHSTAAQRPPSKLSKQDEEELRLWAASAQPGEQKEFEIGKERRKYLHNLLQTLNSTGEYGPLQGDSIGAGRYRKLVISKGSRPLWQIAASAASASPTGHPLGAAATHLVAAGHRLGGTKTHLAVAADRRAAAAAAAERRMSIGVEPASKKARLSSSPAARPQFRSKSQAGEDSASETTESSDAELVPLEMTQASAVVEAAPASYDEEMQLEEAIRLSLKDVAVSTATSSGSIVLCEEALPMGSSTGPANSKTLEEATPQPLEALQMVHSTTFGLRTLVAKRLASPIDLDVSDESQPQEPHQQADAGEHHAAWTLHVDLRERNKDKSPRDIFEAAQKELAGIAEVTFQALKIADYVWTKGAAVRGLMERKTVGDLVGRSHRQDHLRQLRATRTAARCCGAKAVLLIEGDLTVAGTGKAIPYGAPELAVSALDEVLRGPADVSRLLLRVALFFDTFVLFSKGPPETTAILKAWTTVLQRSSNHAGATTTLDDLKSITDQSDAAYSTLMEAGRAAGLHTSCLECLGRFFWDIDDLHRSYALCRNEERRRLLLAPAFLFAAGEPGTGNGAAAAQMSCLLSSQAASIQSGSLESLETPRSKLVVEAPQSMKKDFLQHSSADVEVREMPDASRPGFDRVRMQLVGTGRVEAFRSVPTELVIVGGSSVLQMLQQTSSQAQVSCEFPLAEAAEATAHQLSQLFPRDTRKLLVLEGLQQAAQRVCKQGSTAPVFAVASRAVNLQHSLIAALAVRHNVPTLIAQNRVKLVEAVFLLGQVLKEQELLTL
eukprot:TRINITY_DN26030_c0_g1_i3.p1 TRINITY_DN26030_c0_g1~~TRINITY_DN26030_c0_g1_i3.p1  ORF type:complete len:898 (-),score=152.53 TRINITY_DN26030_c0_g1_i3:25-2688(-)